ncbi:hypothetical protein AB0O67_18995 [Streptomyces sp. NPDC086077]|uniref:hypothetical protein n=1 Tax=Streptomyces sp. NPDC086077 TaxID=3154862 RepID=UPI003424966C
MPTLAVPAQTVKRGGRRAQRAGECRVARRGTGHGSGLGMYRCVVEGTSALPHWSRRLRIRCEIRDDLHQAFVTLGFAVICWRRLRTALC